MTDGKLNLLLVDDHPIFLFGLKTMLSKHRGVCVVATATRCEEALTLAADCLPDVAIVDILMPDISGIELVRHLRASLPQIRILMLSSQTTIQVVEEMLAVGVDGFISKNSGEKELISAIKCVASGEEYYGIDIAHLVERVRIAKSIGDDKFTPREHDIIRLSCEGLSYEDIALRLGIKFKTVHAIKANIFKKLGISSSVELVLYALRNGIVDL